MNLLEFLIIYFSIGAPFAVYFFLQKRKLNSVWLKTFGVAFFWFFYGAFLLFCYSTNITNTDDSSDFSREKIIEEISRKLQSVYSLIPPTSEKIPFFDFRELVERYVGLTLAVENYSETNVGDELFLASGRKKQDLRLANRCLLRKNFLRLKIHQKRAAQDFSQICQNLFSVYAAAELIEFQKEALNLAEQLNDFETVKMLKKIKIENERQITAASSTSKQEKDVWKALQPEQTFILQPKNSPMELTLERRD